MAIKTKYFLMSWNANVKFWDSRGSSRIEIFCFMSKIMYYM